MTSQPPHHLPPRQLPPAAAALAWLQTARPEHAARPEHKAHPEHTAVLLVRHGHVQNPQGLRYGRLPEFHLSAQGRAQAQALAEALAPLQPHARLLLASPLERAQETAAPLAQALGLTPALDDRLIEAWSALDGQPRRAWLDPRHWPLLLRPLKPAWAEPFDAVAQRTLAAVRHAEQQARGGMAVLVSHQSPIWLAGLAAELDLLGPQQAWKRRLPPWLRQPLRCATGSATLLLFGQGRLVQARPAWRPAVLAISAAAAAQAVAESPAVSGGTP